MKVVNRIYIYALVCLSLADFIFGQMALPGGSAQPLTQREKSIILEAHNNARANVIPTASNMKRLVWSPELEESARQYAVACTFRHSTGRRHSRYPWVGENLYIRRGGVRDVIRAMSRWENEKLYYNFATDTCQAGEMCGHYTQMVWAESTEVGCQLHLCPVLIRPNQAPWRNAYNLVCHYGIGGNVRGFQPYRAGQPCSQCQGFCFRNMCSR